MIHCHNDCYWNTLPTVENNASSAMRVLVNLTMVAFQGHPNGDGYPTEVEILFSNDGLNFQCIKDSGGSSCKVIILKLSFVFLIIFILIYINIYIYIEWFKMRN